MSCHPMPCTHVYAYITADLEASHADNPQEDPNIRGDAFKTLIVARLSYDANEEDLEREFARFGTIERVCFPSTRPFYARA